MDAIELLTQDHNEVRSLFEQFKSAHEAEDTETMKEVAGKVFDELEVHTTIEEEVFYPAVHDKSDELAETVDEGLQEHHVVDVLMNEMRDLEAGDDEWVAKMTVLIENVEHHADEEEEELFPEVREELGEDRVQQLGQELEQAKESAKADLHTKEELYAKAKERAAAPYGGVGTAFALATYLYRISRKVFFLRADRGLRERLQQTRFLYAGVQLPPPDDRLVDVLVSGDTVFLYFWRGPERP